MMDYYELECLIIAWAEEKGILKDPKPYAQAMKTVEELSELCHAIITDDKEEIKDALGDIMVTLLIQAHMQDMNLEDCLESAWHTIKDRTGKMVDGQFVKD
jgi:NTP pyrophosphatase (non-canonical NTP hydrolase)